jgi:hypothetical protein
MTRLFSARQLTRLVLAWFVLSLGVAVAGPLVNPQAIQLICSGSGAMKLIVISDDGSTEVSTTMADCPLCASTGSAPPPTTHTQAVSPQPLAYALTAVFSAHLIALSSAPLPARGPPMI